MSQNNVNELTDRQAELLFDAKRKDDPVVVERSARDAAASVLAADLDGLDPTEDVSLEALANRWIDDDGDLTLESLSQMPSTGGDPDADGGAAWSAAARNLDGEDREAVREKLEKADRLEKRTPEFAETLRTEACSIAGVDDTEDLPDFDAL